MKVPIATTLCLFAYGERRIIYSAVFEELIVYILHLHNELLSLVVLAINIEDGTASINSVAKLFLVKIRDILHVLLAMKHSVQKADEQLLVKLRAEQALKTEIYNV